MNVKPAEDLTGVLAGKPALLHSRLDTNEEYYSRMTFQVTSSQAIMPQGLKQMRSYTVE